MRTLLLSLFLICIAFVSQAQVAYTDSLLQVIKTSKDVQTRIDAAGEYIFFHDPQGTEAMHKASKKVFALGEELNLIDMQSYGKANIAYCHYLKMETYKSLEQGIEGLKLAEQVAHDGLFRAIYNNLGIVYSHVNMKKGITFTKKANDLAAQDTSQWGLLDYATGLTNLSNYYIKLQHYDSALVAANRALEVTMKIKDVPFGFTSLYTMLARAHLKLNNPTLAQSYSKLAMQAAKKTDTPFDMSKSLIIMAEHHAQAGSPDSALYYYQQYFSRLEQNKVIPISADLGLLPMYKIYKAKGAEKEALHYLEAYHTAKAKADSTAQTQLLQGIAFEEDLRQQELENTKALAEEQQKHNLQYAAIGVGVLTLLIAFLLLSHTIVANPKLIRFMGMVALLIVFEFFNLLLHPILGDITHHAPILMLLSMASIASLLIPLHHKLEHWVTHKMVERNNRIRLAAAKKIIEQLDSKNTEVKTYQ
jgi:tetratricopeptide (TPR) repeat protein